MALPVLVRFDRLLAWEVLAESAPWVFCERRSGQEPGAQVFMYVAELRAVVGTYAAGVVFEYESLAGLKEGIDISEMARFGANGVDQAGLAETFGRQPHGWAIDVCDPRAFTPHRPIEDTDGDKGLTGPDGFEYLDLGNPEHLRLLVPGGGLRRS